LFRSSFLHVCSFLLYFFMLLFVILQAMIAVQEKYAFSVQLTCAWQYPPQFTMSHENTPVTWLLWLSLPCMQTFVVPGSTNTACGLNNFYFCSELCINMENSNFMVLQEITNGNRTSWWAYELNGKLCRCNMAC
jgi:hypothetical protein